MNLLKEIQQAKPVIKSAIDCLAAHLSTLDKAEAVLLKGNQPTTRAAARRSNKTAIRQDIINIEIKGGKPKIAKKKTA